MSVLGRLEDLLVPDILQIISLSRQTGTLQVNTPDDAFRIFFSTGFIVGASSSENQPAADAESETKYAISDRIRRIVARLIQSTEGEFAFSVARSAEELGLPYDPGRVFPEGGIHPRSLMGKSAPKLRRTPPGPAPDAEPFEISTEPAATTEPLESLLSSTPAATGDDVVVVRTQQDQARTGGHLTVLVEPDPVLRVAIRRALESDGANVRHYISVAEARPSIKELLAGKQFFITVLGTAAAREEISILHLIKRQNRCLPVVAIRHPGSADEQFLLDRGFDAAIAAPSIQRLQASRESVAELQSLAGEVLRVTERAFFEWDELRRVFDSSADPGLQLYQLADQQQMERSSAVLKRLLNQLVAQHDPGVVSQIILGLAAEYLDRAALFLVGPNSFIGLAGYSAGRDSSQFEARAQKTRIPLDRPSALRVAVERRATYRKSHSNVEIDDLIEHLGPPLPTEWIVVPILRDGEVTGILYGDNAEYHGPLGRTDALEMFLAEAGLALS